MNTIIEAKEIINKHTGVTGIPNAHETLMAMQEYAELYCSRKCEEAGMELPSKDEIRAQAVNHGLELYKKTYDAQVEYSSTEGHSVGAEWMKEKSSTLLASRQGEIDEQKKQIQKLIKKLQYCHNKVYTLYHSQGKKHQDTTIDLEKLWDAVEEFKPNN